MNHHERCQAAIEGRPVDRAPRYVPGIACDVISRILGRKAHGGTGSLHYAEACALLKGEAAHQDFVEQLFEDLADFYRAFDIDVFRIPWRRTRKPTAQPDDYTFVYGDAEGDHQVFKYDPNSAEFGCVKTVVRHPVNPEDKLRSDVEHAEQAIREGKWDTLSLGKDHQYVQDRYGDEFFVICNGGYISVGMDTDDLILLLTETELVQRKVMTLAEHDIAFGKCLAASTGPDVLVGGGDMAGNDGPFYSPPHFREVMLPAFSHMIREVRKQGVHYIFRSDGNLWPVADMLFDEAACPGYGEVDRLTEMTTGALRERFPQLVLWGNMASQNLQEETAAWVREDAERCVKESGGSGYFHGPSNSILRGTPVENVEAMFSV